MLREAVTCLPLHQQVANVYVRGQIENILGFEGYVQSLLYILLRSLWFSFGGGNNTFKIYLKDILSSRAIGWIWPMSQSWLTPAI